MSAVHIFLTFYAQYTKNQNVRKWLSFELVFALYFRVYSNLLLCPMHETMWIQGYRVVRGEDKTHSSGLIFSNHDILVANKNPEIHCFPAMDNVQDKTKNLLYKLVKESWKFTIFNSFMVQFFLIPRFFTCIFFLNLTLSPFWETFLTLWPFYLCHPANHLWCLHVLWRVEFKKRKKSTPSSW